MAKTSKEPGLPRDVGLALGRLVDLVQPAPEELLAISRDPGPSSAEDDRSPQSTRVADWLYRTWYTAQPDRQGPDVPETSIADLRGALRVAPAASSRWQRGWVVLQAASDGQCVAGSKTVTRKLRPGQYANLARPGLPPAPGDALVVNELIDWVDEPTGYWFAQSSHGEPSRPLVRLYFNVDCRHLGGVLHDITTRLDERQVKYSLKCPVHLASMSRVDTMVVYLGREDWTSLEPLAVDLARRLEGRLRKATPPLTRPLAPGMAFAEDPGDSTSFGEARCRALAQGVLDVVKGPRLGKPKAIALLAESLRAASIDPRKPWQVALR